jgi:hypothetical protein
MDFLPVPWLTRNKKNNDVEPVCVVLKNHAAECDPNTLLLLRPYEDLSSAHLDESFAESIGAILCGQPNRC